jgi:hypothetical protein
VDTTNSQKKSAHTSMKSERNPADRPPAARSPSTQIDDDDLYVERTFDLVGRIRAAREAAQREMESFGDVSEYTITKLHGQKKEIPKPSLQGLLPLESDAKDESAPEQTSETEG